jgi:hypothetical protein
VIVVSYSPLGLGLLQRQPVVSRGGVGHFRLLYMLRAVVRLLITLATCRRFETGGSLSRRVSVLRAPAQMGRARGRA